MSSSPIKGPVQSFRILPETEMTHLNWSGTPIRSITSEISQYKSLKSLDLSNTKLTQVSFNITKLIELEKLTIDARHFHLFQAALIELPSLKTLVLKNTMQFDDDYDKEAFRELVDVLTEEKPQLEILHEN